MEGEIRKYESSSYAQTGLETPTKLAIARRQLPYHVTQLAEKKVVEKLMRSDNVLLPYILGDLLNQLNIYLENR